MPDFSSLIGQTISHYRIVEKLGGGGMGVVYKAEDSRLHRLVALKFLPEDVARDPQSLARFQREAQAASALNHPNICTIHDIGEDNGRAFIAMEFLDGQTLKHIITGQPMELERLLEVGIQVADALASAHARGIIHRDIKSGNVMVTDSGQVKILDFGLAKLLDETDARTSNIDRTELTEVGVPYGTATYAAPEQAMGDKVDARADIFSTGVLLYEMLTGTWPFRGKSTVDVRHAVIHDQAKTLVEMRPGATPVRLQQILDKALSKSPRDRYQKIDELRDELRKVLHDVASGAKFEETTAPKHLGGSTPVGRAMRWLRKLSGARESASSSPQLTSRPLTDAQERSLTTTIADREKKSLAVLPFKNLNNDPASTFYEFALADAVITELARIRSLVVRPSSVMSKYQGQAADPSDVGRELNVDAVLSAGFIHVGTQTKPSEDRPRPSLADIVTRF